MHISSSILSSCPLPPPTGGTTDGHTQKAISPCEARIYRSFKNHANFAPIRLRPIEYAKHDAFAAFEAKHSQRFPYAIFSFPPIAAMSFCGYDAFSGRVAPNPISGLATKYTFRERDRIVKVEY